MKYEPTAEILAVHNFVLSEREKHVKAVMGAQQPKVFKYEKKKPEHKKRTSYFDEN